MTLFGHRSTVSCVDISTDFAVIVSGGDADGAIMFWDLDSGRLIRRHTDLCEDQVELRQITSVSINKVCGDVVVVSPARLRVFSVNGNLLCQSRLNWDSFSSAGAITIAVALPSADWQDGVIAATGHASGQLCLWKKNRRPKRQSEDATTAAATAAFGDIMCVFQTSKAHSSTITAMQLCPAAASTFSFSSSSTSAGTSTMVGASGSSSSLSGRGGVRRKQAALLPKTYEPAYAYELCVGDSDGVLSRWMTPQSQ